MSAQPIQPIRPSVTPERAKQEELAKKKRRSELRTDALYIVGALLVTAGIATLRISWGLIAAGFFCMLLPLLELATGFIRGLRIPLPRR